MKRIKRIASLILAMAMIFAMSATVLAANNGEPNAPEGQAGTSKAVTHTYEIYQIFTADYADKVLSNIKWGANGTGAVGANVETEVLDALEAVTENNSDTEQLAVIQQYANLDSNSKKISASVLEDTFKLTDKKKENEENNSSSSNDI